MFFELVQRTGLSLVGIHDVVELVGTGDVADVEVLEVGSCLQVALTLNASCRDGVELSAEVLASLALEKDTLLLTQVVTSSAALNTRTQTLVFRAELGCGR